MSWISGGCRNSGTSFGIFWTAFYEAELSQGNVGIVAKIRQGFRLSPKRSDESKNGRRPV
eukprot:2551577-Pleurochrysis_carterae.AAC.1